MKATTKQFMECMDKLFSAYAKDGVMDDYRMEENVFYTSNKDDASYMWSALDGAVHLFNSLHGTTLSLDPSDDKVVVMETTVPTDDKVVVMETTVPTDPVIESSLQEVTDIVDSITCDMYAEEFYDTFGIGLTESDLRNDEQARFWTKKYNSVLDSLKIQ